MMGLLRFAPFFLLYAIAALLSLRATDRSIAAGDRRTWRAVAILLGLLLVEKALEQSILFQIARLTVGDTSSDWRQIQAAIIAVAALLGLGGALVAWERGKSFGGNAHKAMALVLLLIAYAVVRAVSFNRVEMILGIGVGPLRLRHAIELLLIALIGLLALRTNDKRG
jgi:hypothetical protein